MLIHFYEKPGCINNTRQKKMLRDKGYRLRCFNLFDQSWTPANLIVFLEQRPVYQWFNKGAVRVKSGEIDPLCYDSKSALVELVKDPSLIVRPLLTVEGKHDAGFDSKLAMELLQGEDANHLLACTKDMSDSICSDGSTKM